MTIRTTRPFDRDYDKLPEGIKQLAEKQFTYLLEDPRHPSLRAKKMKGKWGQLGIIEARVTKGYRFTFMIQGDQYILRRIGSHDILKNP
jgi:mRNA-degrading endonuclease YafQ of YafQ-DinJ toxin-antitoxin module